MTLEFKSCKIDDKHGYHYEYSCCRLQGQGGCEALFTPWTQIEDTDSGAMEAMLKNEMTCPMHQSLKGFVLEAKEPGNSLSELRYTFECCGITQWKPISVPTETTPMDGAFENYEGIYLP